MNVEWKDNIPSPFSYLFFYQTDSVAFTKIEKISHYDPSTIYDHIVHKDNQHYLNNKTRIPLTTYYNLPVHELYAQKLVTIQICTPQFFRNEFG